MFGVDNILPGNITVLDPSLTGDFHASFSAGMPYAPLCGTSFHCSLIIANGVFSFIFSDIIKEAC